MTTAHDTQPTVTVATPLAVCSAAGLERWEFLYTLDNFGPETLESGLKTCENKACGSGANMIVGDDMAIYYACDRCSSLIPNGNVLRSNVKLCGERSESERT